MSAFLLPVALLAGLLLGVFFDRLYPGLVRYRNRKRFAEQSAAWVGLAVFAPAETHQHPVVSVALSGVGAYYGEKFSGYGPGWRSVGGVLWLLPDRLLWEPQRYLGRGEARQWEVELREITGVEISGARLRRGARALVHTTRGPIRIVSVSDGNDFSTLLSEAIERAPSRTGADHEVSSQPESGGDQFGIDPSWQQESQAVAARVRRARLVLVGSALLAGLGLLLGLLLRSEWVLALAAALLGATALGLLQLWSLVWLRARRERLAASSMGTSN